MRKILDVIQQTNNKFLNLYHIKGQNKCSEPLDYYFASRLSKEKLRLKTKKKEPDGVMIYGIYGEARDKVVLVKQYRYPINDYVYELPAGLIDSGENMYEAAVREFKEETGMELDLIETDPIYTNTYYTSVGMSDECISTVYGYAKGMVDYQYLEHNEDLFVVLADQDEVLRILREENVAAKCAYLLLQFVNNKTQNLSSPFIP